MEANFELLSDDDDIFIMPELSVQHVKFKNYNDVKERPLQFNVDIESLMDTTDSRQESDDSVIAICSTPKDLKSDDEKDVTPKPYMPEVEEVSEDDW